jgi:beta-galactosidase
VNVDFNVVMHNETLGAKRSRIYYELFLNDTLRLTGGNLDVEGGMYGVDTMRFGAPVPDSVLWSIDNPSRVSLRLKNRIEGRDVEFYNFDVALRELRYEKGEFYINNAKCDITWHEISPRVSVEELADIYASGVRAVRFTAGYVRDELLEYCDSHGLYVAITAPINSSSAGLSRRRNGNPSNNPSWRTEYVQRTVAAIYTTKRYPCVVAYFLADDSANGICLYESYLAAKAITSLPVFYEDGGGEWNSDDVYNR